FAEPDPEMPGEVGAGNFFRNGTETTDVADQQSHRANGGAGRARHRARHGELEFRAGKIGVDLLEDELVMRDLDAVVVIERGRHHLLLVSDEGAVAAAEIDDLILVAIVTTHERVLAGDERAAAQANGVVTGATDGGGVADR